MSFRDNMRGNPALWLVIGLPILSIVAGVGLVIMATGAGGHDVSPDEVTRMSQIQQTDLGPDYRAMQMNLSAVLREQDGEVYVNPVTGDFPQTALTLHVRHPTQAAADREVLLLPQGDGQWLATLALDASHDWNLVLAAPDGSWRVHGRLPAGQQAVRLAHAFDRDAADKLDAVRGAPPRQQP